MASLKDTKYFSKEISFRFIQAMDKILSDRSKGKITAKIFGDKVGIASSSINRIRTNPESHFVTIEALGRLCYHFDVSPVWLITGKEELESLQNLMGSLKQLEVRINAIEKKITGSTQKKQK